MKAYRKTVIIIICAMALVHAGTARAGLENFRAHAIQPDSFDYVFTAVVSGTASNPRLSFNDRYGRTHFARVGEQVGEYVVKSFEPRTDRVFNESINSYKVVRAGTVIMEGPGGNTIALERDERAPMPGFRANVVRLNTGCHNGVREGDVADFNGDKVSIMTISEQSVLISSDNTIMSIPLISQAEIRQVATLRGTQRKKVQRRVTVVRKKQSLDEREKALSYWQQSLSQREKDLKKDRLTINSVPLPEQKVTIVSSQPRMFVGTEYRYPTAFTAVPASCDQRGSMVSSGYIVPTAFETRTTGMGMSTSSYVYPARQHASRQHGAHQHGAHQKARSTVPRYTASYSAHDGRSQQVSQHGTHGGHSRFSSSSSLGRSRSSRSSGLTISVSGGFRF